MTKFRRLNVVGAVMVLTAVATSSHVWGESSPDRLSKEQVLNSRIRAMPVAEEHHVMENLAASKFAQNPLLLYQTQAGDTLFALQVKPKLDAVPARPRDFLVLIDTSASQVGAPLVAARQISDGLAEVLKPEDRISIWTVNTPTKNSTRSLTRGFQNPKAGEVKLAIEALKNEIPLGSTDLKNGLAEALKSFKTTKGNGRQRVLLFLGDGMSVQNVISDQERQQLAEDFVKEEIAFFPIPLGLRIDSKNLHGLASSTGGAPVRILPNDQTPDVIRRLEEAVAAPILYTKKFELSKDVIESMPGKLPPVRADAPTLVVGKIKPGKTLDYTVQGTVAGRDVVVQMSETVPTAEIDNYFLVSMVEQWRDEGARNSPALIRADRALAFAFEQNRLTRDEFLAQAEWALGRHEFEAAEKLFQNAHKIDPHDPEADAGIKVVARIREGKLKKEQLVDKLAKPNDMGLRIQKKDKDRIGKDPLGRDNVRIDRDRLLVLAQVGEEKPPVAPDKEEDDFIKVQKGRLAVEEQRVTEVVNEVLRLARREVMTEPDAANERLKRTLINIRDNRDLSDTARRGLMNRLEAGLRDMAVRGAQVKRQQENDLRMLADARRRFELDEERLSAAELAKQRARAFHNLMNMARYEEAYKQSLMLQQEVINRGQPIPVQATAAYNISMVAHNYREARELVRLRENRFLAVMMQVERSHIPFSDEPPVHYPPAATWREITKLRKERYESSGLGGDTPRRTLELRDKMTKPVTLEKGIDPNTPLKDALEFLSDRFDLTILIDTAAFEEKGLKEVENQPVKLQKMVGVSLGTVLRLLLGQLAVPGTYLIRREYIEITTGERALLEKATRVFPVADLVIPIPNSISQQGLGQNLAVLGQSFSVAGGLGQGGGLGALGGALGALGALGAGGLGALGALGGGGLALGGALGALGGGGLALGGLGAGLGAGGLGAAGLALGAIGAGGVGAGGLNLGAGGGQVNLGFGGGLLGVGGGALGQFGNLGGQFGLQGGDQSAILVQIITQTVARGEWAGIPAFNQPGGAAPPPGAAPDEDQFLNPEQLNSLGYYPPSLALIVRGTSRIHTSLGGGLLGPRPGGFGAPPPLMGAVDNPRPGVLVLKPGEKNTKVAAAGANNKDPKKPFVGPEPKTEVVNLDPAKVWQEALAKGVDDPGLIIACADFLVQCRKYDHAAEFLKANLRHGIVSQPWVYEALAIALKLSGGSQEEIERAQVSATDLEPQDAQAYMSASKAMGSQKRYDLALAYCRQAAVLDPGISDSYSDALVYAEMGRDADAMTWAARNLLQREWPEDGRALHAQAKDKMSALEGLLRKDQRIQDAQKMVVAVDLARERDLVIKLTWQGDADLDMRVKEPINTVCSVLHRQSPGGGIFTGDGLSESLSESYVAAQAFSGEYEITVDRAWGRPLGAKATIEIIRHQGTARESRDRQTFVFDRSHTLKVSMDDGRRTSSAAVSANQSNRKTSEKAEVASPPTVLNKLRNIADPVYDGAMGGGLNSIGVETPGKAQAVYDPKRSPYEHVAQQAKVSPFMTNGADLTAQATVSPDQRYVRLSLSPVFRTATRVQPASVVVNPLIPGGRP